MQPWHVFFNLFYKLFYLKYPLFLFLLLVSTFVKAQEIENIYVNLYTDSLKKGTYNYINIDGKLANGNYLPLDSTNIIFTSSDGKFFGNSLWIDPKFSKDKVTIKAALRSNPQVCKQFDIYIKKIPNPDKLKSVDEIMNEMQNNSRGSKKKRS
jgi:hypothetical protein